VRKTKGYLGLGSNLGRRERSIMEALRRIEAVGIPVSACSSLYETPPAEGAGGGPFVNAVAEVRPLLCPEDLLNRLKTIEKSMGRTGGHNRPREIDIDILCIGDTVLETSGLTIPHLRYAERAFVLTPLREISPGFRCPRTGRTIDELIDALGCDVAITRVSGRHIIAAHLP
jgi:2-amino-4-hydroxy-6-hydroxymethyldihydropteridine diphosphokinase